MSPGIWTRCGGSSELRPLGCEPWRVVESQRLVSTRPLVDSDAEHQVLEELIDRSKPPLPREAGFARLHYLLASPFRYPPLPHGSRFGRRHERSLWYGSEALRTALAETAYYRLVFFSGSAARLAPHALPFSAFRVRVRTKLGVDLSRPAFASELRRICSPSDYAVSQALGSDLRAAGVEAVRYPSARDPERGLNLALFTAAAFASPRPLAAPETWHCTVSAGLDVAFRHERATGIDTVEFPRSAFLVRGKLPAPAV